MGIDKEQIVSYVLNSIDYDVLEFVYNQMCINRTSLQNESYMMYDTLADLVNDFIEDNELSQEWFETEIGDIEDLFDELIRRV